MKFTAGGCSSITGINVNDSGAFFFCPQYLLEGDGVMLGGIAAHNEDNVGLL